MTADDTVIKEKKKKKNKVSDTIRFYLTAFFILLACFSTFAFVFLVPFVIDPGFATLFAEFDPQPVTCITVSSIYRFGLSNCGWSSCREGCTRDVFKCTQIYVNYFKDTSGEYQDANYTDPEEFDNIVWQYERAKIFPNIRGCGYPPEVNCTIFNKKYKTNGTTFPCYYSTLQPNVTITNLNIEEIKETLVYAIVLPWTCFIASVLYLLITYAGMKKPEVLEDDEPEEVNSSKASKEASNYSLRSISKTINQGVNRFIREPDDNGCLQTDRPPQLALDSNLLLEPNKGTPFSKRNLLPPIIRESVSRMARSRIDPAID